VGSRDFFSKFYNFLLPWRGRPITVDNFFRKTYDRVWVAYYYRLRKDEYREVSRN
jgi:hypothetical protein